MLLVSSVIRPEYQTQQASCIKGKNSFDHNTKQETLSYSNMAQQKSNTRQAIFDAERKTKFSNSYSFPALKKELFLIKI